MFYILHQIKYYLKQMTILSILINLEKRVIHSVLWCDRCVAALGEVWLLAT